MVLVAICAHKKKKTNAYNLSIYIASVNGIDCNDLLIIIIIIMTRSRLLKFVYSLNISNG